MMFQNDYDPSTHTKKKHDSFILQLKILGVRCTH
jgi:hypothetical protein